MKRTILSVAAVVTLLLLSSSPSTAISSSGHLVAAQQDSHRLADTAFSDVESLINKATGADDAGAAAAPSLNVSDYYHSYEALERDNAASWDLFDRVVVMGDLHGDVRKLHMVLRGAGLVSRRPALPTDPPIEAGDIYPEWHWKAKRTLLVQLGDMVDRGWYDLEVVRYLMRLEAEARAMDSAVEMPHTQPGAASSASTSAEDVIVTIDTSKKVITREANADGVNGQEDRRGASRAVILLGNHELMQLSGQMHYASAQATQGWGGAATRHRDLDRDAPMGKWLRRRPVAMLAWDTIFLHAGLSPEAIAIGADGLNERMWRQLNATIAPPPPGFDSAAHEATMSERAAAERDEIRRRRDRIDALAPRKRRSSKQRHIGKTADGRDMTPEEVEAQTAQDRAFAEEEDFMLGDSGPVWTRRMVNLAQHGRCDLVMQALSAWNKSRIIVGHTPTRTAQVEAHCGGRLIAADTGLSEWMYGGKSIVELKKVRTIGSSSRTVGAAPQGNDDTRVEVAELSFENEAEAEAAAAEIEAAEHAALHTKSSKTDSGAAGVQTSEEVEAALRSDPEALQEILQLLAEQKRAADAATKKN